MSTDLTSAIVSIVLFICLILINYYFFFNKGNDTLKNRLNLGIIIFFNLSLLFMVFCLLFLHKDFSKFSLIHISIIVFFMVLPHILSLLTSSKKIEKIIYYSLTFAFAIMFITRLCFDLTLYEKLPLNVCNIAIVLILLRPFYHNKLFDSYILTFALLGFILNNVLGQWYSYEAYSLGQHNQELVDFFHIKSIESNFTHMLFYTYAIYLYLRKLLVPNIISSIKNLFWIVPVYYVLVFTNQIYQYNYFFTSEYVNPIAGIYNLCYSLAGFKIASFKINFLYDVIIISCSALAMVAVNWLLLFISNKTNNKIETQI